MQEHAADRGRDVSQDAVFLVQFRDPAPRPNLFYRVLDGVNTFLSSGALPDFGSDLDALAAWTRLIVEEAVHCGAAALYGVLVNCDLNGVTHRREGHTPLLWKETLRCRHSWWGAALNMCVYCVYVHFLYIYVYRFQCPKKVFLSTESPC